MKKILIIILVVVAVTVGTLFYLHQNKLQDFEPQIKERLNKLVTDASNGLYHLEIEKLETDVVSSRIIIINAHLKPDSVVFAQLEKSGDAPEDIFDITISQLSIDDIAPSEFLMNKAITLRRIFINKPVIAVVHKNQPNTVPQKDTSGSIFDKIKKDISRIQIDTIIIQNVDFIYTNKTLKDKETRLSNVKFFITDILIDSSTQSDQQRFLFAKNCLISLKDYKVNTSDSLYRFAVGEVDIETVKREMRLKQVRFLPRIAAKAFYKRVKHQQDRFEINMEQVIFNRINWWALLAEESFIVKKVSMKNGTVKVFNDKSQPLDTRSKVGKYPHQMLMKLPFRLRLDTLAVAGLNLSYTELNPKSGETGTLFFDNIRGTLTNITNDPNVVKINNFMKINATALFMKKSPLSATFLLDLARHKNGNFSVAASLGALGASEINPITVPLGMLKVNSLNVKSLNMSMKGDNLQGAGIVKMIYDDLNVTALKASDDTLKKRGLLSFIANTFVIKKENPFRNKPVRVENAYFNRDINRSFFNLIWKTTFTGVGKTAGYKVKK